MLVAKKRVHGRRGTIRGSYNAPIAENVPANAVLADASHRHAMAVAATIANQLQMARRDVEWHLGVITVRLFMSGAENSATRGEDSPGG
jgi:hypothetical protein